MPEAAIRGSPNQDNWTWNISDAVPPRPLFWGGESGKRKVAEDNGEMIQ